MAEGWTRYLKGDGIEPYSAGITPHRLDPLAVKVMAEAGVDISHQRPKPIDEVKNIGFDYVITVCSEAEENCPLFPGGVKLCHIYFDDPPELVSSLKDEEEALFHYRRVRDEIRKFVEKLPEILAELCL